MINSIVPEFKEHDGTLNTKKNLIGRFCHRPFQLLEIHKEFYAFPCCPSWLPVIIGNCDKTSIEEVWNSETMIEIRKSVFDGSFKYCDHIECPEIQADRLPYINQLNEFKEVAEKKESFISRPPRELALCYDVTCNLACPSCRKNKIQHTSGKTFEDLSKFTNKVLEFLDKYANQYKITLRVTGSGDPIASPVFLNLLQSLDKNKHSKLEICLQTNGVMLTEKIWNSIEAIHTLIKSISISIDAATDATYRVVRKYGHWDQLQKNLKFLCEKRKQKLIRDFSLNFVVQQKNYKEMPDFVKMAIGLRHIDKVFFSFVNDWNTWSQKEYENQCIWKSTHPEFQSFFKVLTDSVLDNPIVHLGNITEYRKKALITCQ